MGSIRHYNNNKTKDRLTYLGFLILIITGLVLFQLLLPILKPTRFNGSLTAWIISSIIICVLILSSGFNKRLVSISFNSYKNNMTLTTMTLFCGTKYDNISFSDITYKQDFDQGNLRKKATKYLDIYCKEKRIIRLEKSSIDENTFEQIVTEFNELKDLKSR